MGSGSSVVAQPTTEKVLSSGDIVEQSSEDIVEQSSEEIVEQILKYQARISTTVYLKGCRWIFSLCLP
jgi:hypothetical protein